MVKCETIGIEKERVCSICNNGIGKWLELSLATTPEIQVIICEECAKELREGIDDFLGDYIED